MIEEEPKCGYCGEKAVKQYTAMLIRMELQQTTFFVKI
jgi:hypothetical protein